VTINMSAALRKLLDEMVKPEVAVAKHVAMLQAMQDIAPHTISILPAPNDEPLEEFNCIMYALGIVARLEHSCSPLGRWYADTGFMRYLVDRAVLKRGDARRGAIITWSTAGGVKHAGRIVAPGRVASKWGVSHVYEHGFYEVPTGYGSPTDFYAPVESETVLTYLGGYLNQA